MGTEAEAKDVKDKGKKRLTFDEMRKKMDPQVQDSTRAATGLGISRIPYEQKKRFMEIADSQFRGDWALTLAYLVNYYDDMQLITRVLDRQLQLEKRLDSMLGASETKVEEKKIKLMNGVEVKAK
jgi:hypothetical protein